MRNIGPSVGISFVTTLMARRSQLHQAQLAGSMSGPRSRERLDLARPCSSTTAPTR